MKVERCAVFVGLALFLVAVLFPFYWMVLSSFKSFSELFSIPPTFFPKDITFAAYREVLFEYGFIRCFANSFYVASIVVLANLSLATAGAYSLARLRFRGKGAVSSSLLLIYTFPPILLVVPLYALFAQAGLRDSLNGLIITYLAQTLPLSLYILSNYYKSIPKDLEEAALVDGLDRIGVIIKITLPLSAPAILSVSLYTFIIAWNEFIFAYIFLDSPERFTLSKSLFHLFASYHTAWDVVMAASVIMVLPVIVIFLLFEKHLISGLTAGGIKG